MVSNLEKYPRRWDSRVRGVLYLANTIAYFRQRRTIVGRALFDKFSRLAAVPEEHFIRVFDECWLNTSTRWKLKGFWITAPVIYTLSWLLLSKLV